MFAFYMQPAISGHIPTIYNCKAEGQVMSQMKQPAELYWLGTVAWKMYTWKCVGCMTWVSAAGKENPVYRTQCRTEE
jgi:hypothetical protein